MRVHLTGAVTVYTGTSPHGQGHETGFAQIVADRLGVDPEQVEVIHGDTGTGPQGLGTYGSRSLAVGGEAVARAAEKVAEKAKAHRRAQARGRARGHRGPSTGSSIVRGSPDQGLTLAEVAGMAYIPEDLPEDMEPGLEDDGLLRPVRTSSSRSARTRRSSTSTPRPGRSRSCATSRSTTAARRSTRCSSTARSTAGSPTRSARSLYEQVVYDEDGQLVTGTFVDYALPTAAELPSFETDRTETRSPTNSLGVKGIGEAGTIAASAAVTNAVIDALRPLGITHLDMPLTPMRVCNAIQEAGR